LRDWDLQGLQTYGRNFTRVRIRVRISVSFFLGLGLGVRVRVSVRAFLGLGLGDWVRVWVSKVRVSPNRNPGKFAIPVDPTPCRSY
jgi:hypothetical protein